MITSLTIALGLALAAPAAGAGPLVYEDAGHEASPIVALQPPAMVRIDGGTFRPLYTQPGETVVAVSAFMLDARPVTRGEFEAFIERNPRWRRDRVAALFADRNYLRDWATADSAGESTLLDLPVTSVSWFAARAYCAERGARLPTTAEWEYVARADEGDTNAAASAAFRRRALELSMQRRSAAVGSAFRNAWGVYDMHGGVMEWVSDFQAIFAGSDSRVDQRREREMTCAAGATTTGDASDYAAFLRYAFRATVEARSTSGALGFRCAGSIGQ